MDQATAIVMMFDIALNKLEPGLMFQKQGLE
jgi:hypothetical protein